MCLQLDLMDLNFHTLVKHKQGRMPPTELFLQHNYLGGGGDYEVKQLTKQQKDKLSSLEDAHQSKFCTDYFVPISQKKIIRPDTHLSQGKEKYIQAGRQAIAKGEVCLILNASGHGEDSDFFNESKAWNSYDWELGVNHLEFLIERIKSIVKVAQREVAKAQELNLSFDGSESDGSSGRGKLPLLLSSTFNIFRSPNQCSKTRSEIQSESIDRSDGGGRPGRPY